MRELFWRDASERLTFDLPCVDATDYPAVCRNIADGLGLSPAGEVVIGPEHMFWDFRRGNQIVSLDWDICIHDWGGWKHYTAEDERERSLQDQFGAWLERLRLKAQALRRLHDRGWEVELVCFAAASDCLDLTVTVLGELAGLGIGLVLTFSAGGDASAAEPNAPDRGRGGR